MLLRPIFDSPPVSTPDLIPAWNAIEQQQTAPAGSWWLITQPNHAALSGEIARRFAAEGFPKADTQIVRAIATHDAGWELFESNPMQPCMHPDGRPVSFFEVRPQTFLLAWSASIERAQEGSVLGGYLVSQHFAWLAEYRLRRADDPPEVRRQIAAFLVHEKQREASLYASAGIPAWDSLLPLLQFCDLCSLYLCSGARQAVEFPQEFAAGKIRAHYEDGQYVLSPNPFGGPWTVSLNAVHYSRAASKRKVGRITLTVK